MNKLGLSVAVLMFVGSLMLFSSSVYATCAGQGCFFGTEPWCTCEAGMGAEKEEKHDQERKSEDHEK